MPKLKSLVKPGFKLKDAKAGKVFEQALDTAFPISTGLGDKNLKAKAIVRDGRKWTFIGGEFFNDLKGFVWSCRELGMLWLHFREHLYKLHHRKSKNWNVWFLIF